MTELPAYVQIEPVGQCNLRCKMCPIQFRQDGAPGGPAAFMSYQTFCELIDQFPALTELHLQGLGEPMLHPRFFDMVAYASGRGVRVTTNTNLTVCTERRIRECLESGLDTMYISLDGATAAVYEAIRVDAKFDRIMANLERLMRMRAQVPGGAPRLHVGIVGVAMRMNLHELPDIVRLAHRHGISDVSFQHLCHDFGESSLPALYRPMRNFVDEQTLLHEDPARVASVFDEIRTVAQTLGMTVRIPPLEHKPRPAKPPGSRCDWPRRGAYISYDGQAMPCCMIATPDRMNFGNMARDGVAAIWGNASYEDFRERLASDTPPEICKSCALYAGTF